MKGCSTPEPTWRIGKAREQAVPGSQPAGGHYANALTLADVVHSKEGREREGGRPHNCRISVLPIRGKLRRNIGIAARSRPRTCGLRANGYAVASVEEKMEGARRWYTANERKSTRARARVG
ncbi:hypothetical protein SKAU_G00311530 [Synaphobranchus kaupii]|uniref:Uncharacterized protein n=1 Tax=Synaphobranchus kaupii TaxID=118154 RepID=A0A9Q1IJ68_SYNKA|nr:hypothetical protein SKAU_G00311530 [Synaphobranchus kaupii]